MPANTYARFPDSREKLKQYCLRALGAPVIKINVSNEQVEDRVDEGLRKYWDYHYDGTDFVYIKHQITDDDKTNGYFVLPDNIIGAINMFDIGDAMSTNNLFDIRYQIALNDLYTLTNVSMIPYYMAMRHIQFIEQLLVGRQPLRYNRRNNRLYVDMDWDRLAVGQYLVIQAYQVVDPEEYSKAYNDAWLLKYVTALIKRQWGANLRKFTGVPMLGGVTVNGQAIYDEAVEELRLLDESLIRDFSIPPADMIG